MVRISDTLKQQNDLTSFPVAYSDGIWLDKNKGVGTADYSDLQTMYNSGELGGGGQSIQIDELPLASAEESGKIYQYIGSSGTYTKGFFYECMNYGYYCWTIDDERYYTKSTDNKVGGKVYTKDSDVYTEVGTITEVTSESLSFEDENDDTVTLGRYSDGDISNIGYEWANINVESSESVVDEIARERAYEAIELAETKLSSVTTMPTDIQYTTAVLYVGETTSKYIKGHIYQCTPYEKTYLTTKFTASSKSFDLDTLEEINFDKALISEESYDISGFTCDGNAVNLSRVYFNADDELSTIVASYSGTSSLQYITSIDWENKTLVLGSSVSSYSSHGGFSSSNFMSTYTVFEWVDISQNAVEEVTTLPQSLENKVYNKATTVTFSSGSSASTSIESLEQQFPKDIFLYSYEEEHSDYTTYYNVYSIKNGTLTYNGTNVNRVKTAREDSTVLYLYNGSTEVAYIADDYLTYDLIYTVSEVYSKDKKLATFGDIPTVDQSYSATSTNAQSGVAINEALDNCVKTSGDQEINGTKTFNSDIGTNGMYSLGEGLHGSVTMYTRTNIGRVNITGDGNGTSAQVDVVGGNNNESYINMSADLVKANNKNVVTSVNSTQADNSGNVTLSIPTITVDGNTATIIY